MVETTGRVLTPALTRLYVQHYGRFDPKLKILARNVAGYLLNDARHFDENFVARDLFYQEYSRQVGTRHTLHMLAERSAGRQVYLAVMRPRRSGPYQAEAEAYFRRASAHFMRALALKENLDRLHRVEDVLDSLEFGVAVVDSFYHVRLLNRAAKWQLMQDGELHLCRGMLSARSPARARKLHALIDFAASGDPEGGVMRVSDRDGNTFTLRIAPLPADSRIATQGSPAVLILICGESKCKLNHADLAALYGFTASESRVAIAVADGTTLAAMATRHGVKYSTVRTQLLSVMQKMSVHRQADVARLLVSARGRRA
jgi:DNA-binding CsgD family transcriptional regulator